MRVDRGGCLRVHREVEADRARQSLNRIANQVAEAEIEKEEVRREDRCCWSAEAEDCVPKKEW